MLQNKTYVKNVRKNVKIAKMKTNVLHAMRDFYGKNNVKMSVQPNIIKKLTVIFVKDVIVLVFLVSARLLTIAINANLVIF